MSKPKLIELICETWKTINQKTEPEVLPKDVGIYGYNLRYDDKYSTISKRLSRAKYNTVSLGTFEIPALFRFYKNSTNSAALIGGYNGSLTYGYDTLGVFSNLKTGFASNCWSFQTYKDLCYCINGEDANQVFTMSYGTLSIAGMGVPSGASPSGTVQAVTGNLSGTLYWAYSFQFDGYQEGNRSPSSAGVPVTASKCNVGIPTSTDLRCTGRYLYRTRSNTTTMYRVATVSGNSNYAYLDNIADSSLDTSIVAPIDYNIPASYKYPCLHKERLFLGWNKTYKSRIIYSDLRAGISYPDVFPANNYLRIAEDDGDEITFIKNDHLGQLVVSKKNSIRIVNTTADSDITWSISDNFSNQGCIAPYTAVLTPKGIMYLSRFGENKKRFVLWTGAGVQVIPELEGIEPILSSIPDTLLEKIKGHYHNGYYYLTYRDLTGGELFCNRVMAIDLLNNYAVSIDKKNVACFCSWNGGNDWGELYSGSSDSTGTVHREDTSEYDLMLRYKSEIDGGVNSYTQVLGTENYPSIGLSATVSGTGVAATWSGALNWASYSGALDTWWLAGEWYDIVRAINAQNLKAIFWGEVAPEDTVTAMYIRTGDTSAACSAAAWQGPITGHTVGDISSVTAAKFIQIRVKIGCKLISDYNKPYVVRNGIEENDYIIKVSAGHGAAAESTIEFEWLSARENLGAINEVYKRLRKRLRSVKVEYEREDAASGSFDFYWYLDGASTATGNFNTSFTEFPTHRVYNFPLSNFCNDFQYRIYSNTDNKAFKVKRILWLISTEPYFVNK